MDASAKKRDSYGFTLIECLLAIAIFSILMTSVYAVFRAGVTAERSGEDLADETRRIRWLMGDLSREIRNTVTEPPGYFKGETDRLTFLTLLPSDDDRSPGGMRLCRVAYRIDTNGMTGLTTLVKITTQPIENESDTMMVQGVFRDVKFTFEGTDDEGERSWSNSWEDGEEAPSAIRVEIVMNDDSDDGGAEIITRYFPVMAGREIGSEGGI